MPNTVQDRLLEDIREKLVLLVDETLNDKIVGPRIKKMLDSYGTSVSDLKKEVVSYTLDKAESGYSNERYRRILARQALYFHNLVPGTYHKRRHGLVQGFLDSTQPSTLMDIGYGVPGDYLTRYLSDHANASACLLDQDPMAASFAKTVLSNDAPNILPRVDFRRYDMNHERFPGRADMYLYLDSIEHTNDPTRYLGKIVRKMDPKSHLVLSLPICQIKGLEGFHFMEWLTDNAAFEWLTEAGLSVMDQGLAYPNPEVDFFAELSPGGYHNYLALCQKRK